MGKAPGISRDERLLPSLRPCGLFNTQYSSSNTDTGASSGVQPYALVLGNSQYKLQTLHNVIGDIHHICGALQNRLFKVKVAIDTTGQSMVDACTLFCKDIPSNSRCYGYFTGLIDRSVLLGVDASFTADTPVNGVSLSYLIELFSQRAGPTVLVIDSARPVLGYRSRRLLSASRVSLTQTLSQTPLRIDGILNPPSKPPKNCTILLSHVPGERLPEECFDPVGFVGNLIPEKNRDLPVSIFATCVASAILNEIPLHIAVREVTQRSGRLQRPWLRIG